MLLFIIAVNIVSPHIQHLYFPIPLSTKIIKYVANGLRAAISKGLQAIHISTY